MSRRGDFDDAEVLETKDRHFAVDRGQHTFRHQSGHRFYELIGGWLWVQVVDNHYWHDVFLRLQFDAEFFVESLGE